MFSLFSIAGVGAAFFSGTLLAFFQFLNSILATGLLWMGDLVTFAMNLDATTNLPVLYEIWTLLRNLCNMGFVVILTVIALSYILSVFPAARSYATTSNIRNLLIAALIINFSFAIGQAIVFAGNALAKVTINILPNTKVTESLVQGFQPVSSQVTSIATIGVYDEEAAKIDPWLAYLKNITTAENARFQACMREERSVGGTVNPTITNVAKTDVDCAQEILAARRGESKLRVGQTSSALTPEEERARNNVLNALPAPSAQLETSLILGEVLTVFINLALFLCFGSIILFLFVRTMAIWILLATAPIYWFSYGVPGKNQLGTWFNEIKGWALFPAIYFAGITPGLLLLANKGQISHSLAQGGSYVNFGGLIFQNIIFYIFIVAVFIGAAVASRKIAFAGISGEITGLKGFASKTGLSMDWALNKVYSGALKNTVEGVGSAIVKRGEQAATNASRAINNYAGFRSKEEVENRLGRIIGVRGADVAEEKNVAKRITDRQKQLETDMKSALNNARTPEEKKSLEDAWIKKLRDKTANSSDVYESLAAGAVLLKDKKVTPDEIRIMQAKYGSFSTLARSEFQKTAHAAIKGDIAKREYKDTKDAAGNVTATASQNAENEYRDFMELMLANNDAKSAGEFYSAIKKGKQKISAVQAAINAKKSDGSNAELIKNKTGKTVTRLYEALALESGGFTGKDWQQIEAKMFEDTALPREKGYDDLEKSFEEHLSTGAKAGAVVGYISDDEQLKRVLATVERVKSDMDIKGKDRKKYEKAFEKAQVQFEEQKTEKGTPEAAKKEEAPKEEKKP